jgi:hypothetical protein
MEASQLSSMVEGPSQEALAHDLLLVRVPRPQDTEQGDHSLQQPHCPARPAKGLGFEHEFLEQVRSSSFNCVIFTRFGSDAGALHMKRNRRSFVAPPVKNIF